MESIQGLVEHIVYHNDTNGYTVFSCLLYKSDAADDGEIVDLGGRRINK